ncbi:MAG: hypothetical protein P1U74_00310 [Legionellaceae bacterium]|nr:hypothetical protein [Legionellaceae bacterium]
MKNFLKVMPMIPIVLFIIPAVIAYAAALVFCAATLATRLLGTVAKPITDALDDNCGTHIHLGMQSSSCS